jgi:hypothetical protein
MTALTRGLSIDEKTGEPRISWRTEADLRSALSLFAYLHGWSTREEVVIPGWGRIDLVLYDRSPGSILIELKRDLSKPSEIRRAFQQADGYGRWWKTNKGEPATVYLAAATANHDVAPVAAAYPEIGFRLIREVIDGLATWGQPLHRMPATVDRLRATEQLLALNQYANGRVAELAAQYLAGDAEVPR